MAYQSKKDNALNSSKRDIQMGAKKKRPPVPQKLAFAGQPGGGTARDPRGRGAAHDPNTGGVRANPLRDNLPVRPKPSADQNQSPDWQSLPPYADPAKPQRGNGLPLLKPGQEYDDTGQPVPIGTGGRSDIPGTQPQGSTGETPLPKPTGQPNLKPGQTARPVDENGRPIATPAGQRWSLNKGKFITPAPKPQATPPGGGGNGQEIQVAAGGNNQAPPVPGGNNGAPPAPNTGPMLGAPQNNGPLPPKNPIEAALSGVMSSPANNYGGVPLPQPPPGQQLPPGAQSPALNNYQRGPLTPGSFPAQPPVGGTPSGGPGGQVGFNGLPFQAPGGPNGMAMTPPWAQTPGGNNPGFDASRNGEPGGSPVLSGLNNPSSRFGGFVGGNMTPPWMQGPGGPMSPPWAPQGGIGQQVNPMATGGFGGAPSNPMQPFPMSGGMSQNNPQYMQLMQQLQQLYGQGR